MTDTLPTIVSTEWLAAHLRDPDLRVVDGTWHMPQLKRDARREFAEAHIPGAVFFDIDEIADTTTPLPHMLPRPAAFKQPYQGLHRFSDNALFAPRACPRGCAPCSWAPRPPRRPSPSASPSARSAAPGCTWPDSR